MNAFKLPTAAAVTVAFSRNIGARLTTDQIAYVIAGKAAIADFCDVNLAMSHAIEVVAPGFENAYDSTSKEQAALFNEVYTAAKLSGYGYVAGNAAVANPVAKALADIINFVGAKHWFETAGALVERTDSRTRSNLASVFVGGLAITPWVTANSETVRLANAIIRARL